MKFKPTFDDCEKRIALSGYENGWVSVVEYAEHNPRYRVVNPNGYVYVRNGKLDQSIYRNGLANSPRYHQSLREYIRNEHSEHEAYGQRPIRVIGRPLYPRGPRGRSS
jgi:hypothetical protein